MYGMLDPEINRQYRDRFCIPEGCKHDDSDEETLRCGLVRGYAGYVGRTGGAQA